MQKISLHDLQVDCVIGAYEDERHRLQNLRGILELSGDFKRDQGIFDYAVLETAAYFILEKGAFMYLEDANIALLDLIQAIATHMRQVDAVAFQARAQLLKPSALQHAFPSVEQTRDFKGCDKLSHVAWGHVLMTVMEPGTKPSVDLDPESALRLRLGESSEPPLVDAEEMNAILSVRTLSLSTNVY